MLRDACASAGFPARLPVVGTIFGIVCGDVPAPVDFAGAKRTDEAGYAAFFQAMLAEGVAMAPGAYEAIFVGLGHTDAVIDEIAARGRACRGRGRCPDRRLAERYPRVMRQVLSWRFVAAIAAVLGLAFVVYVIQASQDDGRHSPARAATRHVAWTSSPSFVRSSRPTSR